MADPTQAELQTQLDEINDQLADMVGAANISVGGLSVNETQLLQDLEKRKASLEWRIANMDAGGTAKDTVSGSQMSGGY